ncbi:BatA domain-containing protein [Pseudoxanthomonas japonensis]|nr:BatA domain-containing protein [Pseudoxanthomonas japonensis]
MSLALLLPAALAALGALLLPLLVHLARRSEQRPTDFAALRWLRQKPRPRHRIRFDERGLLLLRLLLLALLALWLARPVLQGIHGGTPWVVVSPEVDASVARQWGGTDSESRWLAPGFPPLDSPAPASTAPTASLLRELDADLPPEVALTVVMPAWFDGADGERPRLSRAVDWRELPRLPPSAFQRGATEPPVLSVRHAPVRQDALRYLRAAVESWSGGTAIPTRLSVADTGQPLAGDARALIWLAPGAVPPAIRRWIAAGGTALLDAQARIGDVGAMTPYWTDETGATIVEGGALGQGRVLRFTRPLQPSVMPQLLEPVFPARLRELFAEPMPAPARVAARDYAPLSGAAAYPQAPRDLQPWLAMLIALLLVLERGWATSRRRSAAP